MATEVLPHVIFVLPDIYQANMLHRSIINSRGGGGGGGGVCVCVG